MTDFMRFVPAMFEGRQILVEKDPFLIGEIERLEAEIAHGVAKKSRTQKNLEAGDLHAREGLAQKVIIGRAVIASVKLE
ncbi:hypothetical protein DSM21852_43010 (plasmid) [Methylocystis bryophila]|nr:hypothetical protein DSM21852_43010 [Methylocystis bryophila]